MSTAHHRRPARIEVGLLVIGGLLLAGCSSSGSAAKPVDPSTVLLAAGDLPSAWTAKAHDASDDSSDDAATKAVTTCIGGTNTLPDRVNDLHSQDYSMGNSSITSEAQEFKSTSDVDDDVKLFTNPKAKSCLENEARSQIAAELPAGAKVTALNLKIVPGSNGGPSNVVATTEATTTVVVQGQTVSVYTTEVAIRADKVEASVDFDGVGAPIAPSTISNAVAAVAKRAQG